MRNFWENERPSSTEDGTQTRSSFVPESNAETEDSNQSEHKLKSQIRGGIHIAARNGSGGSELNIGQISRGTLEIGTLTTGEVTINENSKTENEFAPNKQTRLESELKNCHSENRRQEREKQRYKNELKETLKGSVVIIS